MNDPASAHFGNWFGVALFVALFGAFLLFVPFYRKAQRKPSGAFLAFVVAYALEMFGIPMSMYAVTWAVGHRPPDGVLWGHTLGQHIGLWGMYVSIALSLVAPALVIAGWREIYLRHWRHDEGAGELVTTGVYRWVRHPQYTGFLLATLGMICEWATLPLLLMWPVLVVVYVRLARREEAEMVATYGAAYVAYRERTGMFLPRVRMHAPRVSPRTSPR